MLTMGRLQLRRSTLQSEHRGYPQLEALIEDGYSPTTPILADLVARIRALPGVASRDQLQECFHFQDRRDRTPVP